MSSRDAMARARCEPDLIGGGSNAELIEHKLMILCVHGLLMGDAVLRINVSSDEADGYPVEGGSTSNLGGWLPARKTKLQCLGFSADGWRGRSLF